MSAQQPPHSKEAEVAVLSSLMYHPHLREELGLKAEDFYRPEHQAIYAAMRAVDEIDILSISNYLKDKDQLGIAGGPAYLMRLHEVFIPLSNIDQHVQIIKDESLRRKAAQAGTDIVQRAYAGGDVEDLISFANQAVMGLDEEFGNGDGLISASDVVEDSYDDWDYYQNNPLPYGEVRGLTTGFADWDRMMNGMLPGDFVVIGARPRIGKTALTITAAHRISKTGKVVAFFALEMKRKALIARLAQANSGISYKKIRRGVSDTPGEWYASRTEFSKFVQAGLQVGQCKTLFIDEASNLGTAQIRARASALARKMGGLDLIIVDTGNLVNEDGKAGENFAQTESRKSKSIRGLAKELDCVVWMTWQLNRSVEQRAIAERKPRLEDFRDTGGIEEHATDVIGLFREEVYNPETEKKGVMDVLALKRREDEGNTICHLGFNADYQRFYDVEVSSKPIPDIY